MSKHLYIFVDESGSYHHERCYTVVGCWCVSERSNPKNILTPTKDRLVEHANEMRPQSNPIGELKGAALQPNEVSTLVETLQAVYYNETTITLSPLPWTVQQPIRFSFFDINPEVAKPVLTDITGSEHQAPQIIQSVALMGILIPVFSPERVSPDLVDDVRVVLDANIWERPAKRARSALEDVSTSIGPFSFSTADSKAAPGIQLADIAAYSWRRNLLESDCKNAIRTLTEHRFPRA